MYQPKTLSTKQLVEDGDYLVYGANGVIGRYKEYNHEESEILMTCRGATCGTINISEPKSWINGNAMVIRPKNDDSFLQGFLVYSLKACDKTKIITGLAQPQITRQNLKELLIPVPGMAEQEAIVAELDEINEAIAALQQQVADLDTLAQSTFYDMFGDPVTNPKAWPIKKLGEVATSKIGLTYKPTDVNEDGIVVLRSGNIQNSIIDLNDLVRVQAKVPEDKIVRKNDILMCTRNGSFRLVGKVALIGDLEEKMTYGAFMTVIRSEYYNYLFNFFKSPAYRVQLGSAGTSTINQITVKMLNDLMLPIPPIALQQEFATKVEAIEAAKAELNAQIAELQTLLASRMDYYFD